MNDATKKLMRQRLESTVSTIATAAMLVKSEMAVIERYLAEGELMDSVGPVLHPTLFNDSERRAVDALMRPIFSAAQTFVRAYDAQCAAGKSALERVKS